MQPGTLQPRALPAARQQALRERFEQAAERAYAGRSLPAHTPQFHAGPIGANALALPGGTLVLGDDLVTRLDAQAGRDADAVIVGVLAHELGHVEHRHGMRLLVQASLLGAVTGLVLGDFSGWLAALPALLGQLAYSRDFERGADAAAIDLLRVNAIDPALMLRLFDVLAEASNGVERSALASRPAEAERRRRFEQASPSYNSKP